LVIYKQLKFIALETGKPRIKVPTDSGSGEGLFLTDGASYMEGHKRNAKGANKHTQGFL
jgi:hypothetical protein